jgi:RNA polymerase sigma-70 factor (ECF subfamily)
MVRLGPLEFLKVAGPMSSAPWKIEALPVSSAIPSSEALPVNDISAEAVVQCPEQMLLDRVRAGDAQALAEVYDAHSRLVYSVALRVLRDQARAEDVLQEVFLRLWRKPESFCVNRGNLAAWLAVTARNRAIDVLRQRHIDQDIEGMELAGSSDVPNEIETSLLIAKARGILAVIPREQAEALEMAFFRGMTHTEIVASTGLPLGTVKTRIRAALAQLGKGLGALRVNESKRSKQNSMPVSAR